MESTLLTEVSTTASQEDSMNKSVTLKDIEQVKNEGNQAFATRNYYKAILFYEEGIRRA